VVCCDSLRGLSGEFEVHDDFQEVVGNVGAQELVRVFIDERSQDITLAYRLIGKQS